MKLLETVSAKADFAKRSRLFDTENRNDFCHTIHNHSDSVVLRVLSHLDACGPQ